jgi:glycerol-3-phosphate dehydrogenase
VDTVERFKDVFRMVLSCHRERSFLIETQPHLVAWMPIAVPFTKWFIWPAPFNHPLASLGPLGLFPLFFKFYDSLCGFRCPPSHIMSPARTARKFPQLSVDTIKYCSVFYEGQFDDARMNLCLALTAAREGATMANYCEVVRLLKNPGSSKVVGAVVRDTIEGKEFNVYARSVLFCGGAYTDGLRRMELEGSKVAMAPAVTAAAGTHIVVPSYFSPSNFGLVDMNTSDGRFLFILPFMGHVLIGTTDKK